MTTFDPAEPPRLVLQVCTRLNIGGPARHLDGLARSLPPRIVTEVAAGRAPAEEGTLAVAAATHEVGLVRATRPVRDVRAVEELRRLVEQRRPAVIATHTSKAGTVGRLAAWRSSVRPATVHTFHGHLLDGYFSAAGRRAVIEVERRLARRTDALVAVSEQVRDELLEVGIGEPARWHVLPIALDLSPFTTPASGGVLRAALGLAADVPLIGAVGRLVPIKQLDVLLDAAARLPGVHVALVGDGPARGELEAQVGRMGLGDRVHLTGWWPDVREVYADLDVVVLTSRNEGTPSALIEASAAGRPVVAADVGGVRDVLAGGRGGWLVPAGSVGAVAAAVAAVLDDPTAAASRADIARQHVLARFDATASAEAHADLYDQLGGG